MPTTSAQAATPAVGNLADRAAARADQAIDTTKRVANDTLDTIQDNVAKAREAAPAAFSRAAAQVDELTRRGMERAREVSADVRDRVTTASDRTVGYIKDEPVKSVLIAVAVGAALAVIVRALSGRSGD